MTEFATEEQIFALLGEETESDPKELNDYNIDFDDDLYNPLEDYRAIDNAIPDVVPQQTSNRETKIPFNDTGSLLDFNTYVNTLKSSRTNLPENFANDAHHCSISVLFIVIV